MSSSTSSKPRSTTSKLKKPSEKTAPKAKPTTSKSTGQRTTTTNQKTTTKSKEDKTRTTLKSKTKEPIPSKTSTTKTKSTASNSALKPSTKTNGVKSSSINSKISKPTNGKSKTSANGYSSTKRESLLTEVIREESVEDDFEDLTDDDKPLPSTRSSNLTEEFPDDFEEYADDFEEYDETADEIGVEIERRRKGVSDEESVRASTSSSTVAEVNEEVGDSLLMQRLARPRTVQRAVAVSSNKAVASSTTEPSRPTTSATRTFHIGRSGLADAATLMRADEAYRRLRSEGRLQVTPVVVVDCAPNRRAEMFNRIVELGVSAQKLTQTGDDNLDNETQTETAEKTDAFVQFPETFKSMSSTSSGVNENRTTRKPSNTLKRIQKTDFEKLNRFLDIAGRLMISLTVPSTSTSAPFHMPMRSRHEFSTGFLQFNTSSLVAKECQSKSFSIHPTNKNRVLIGFYVATPSDACRPYKNHSFMLEYDMEYQEKPINVYAVTNEVSCASYSADGRTAIMAGMTDGSCVIWDLNDNQAVRKDRIPWQDTKHGFSPRLPSYDTSYTVVAEDLKHRKYTNQTEFCVMECASSGSVQQRFTTVDSRGIVTVFGMSKDPMTSLVAGIDMDLGLRPGSRLRLVKLSTITGCGPMAACSAAALSLMSTQSILLGSCVGGVVRIQRDSGESAAKIGLNGSTQLLGKGSSLRRYGDEFVSGPSITSISFSPFTQDVFIASSTTGVVSIYHIGTSHPLLSLNPPQPQSVVDVEWSPTDQIVLYVLYADGSLAEFHLDRPNQPAKSYNLKDEHESNITRMTCWTDARGFSFMALQTDTNAVFVHGLERSLTTSKRDVQELLAAYLG